MTSLLLIDDEPSIQHAFRRVFAAPDYHLTTAATAAEGVAAVAAVRPDVVVLDVRLPDATGLETYHRVRDVNPRVPVVLITGHGTSDLAIEAIKHGAFDYLTKPLELAQLRAVVEQAVRTGRQVHVPAAGEPPAPSGGDALVGRCAAMQEVYKAIGRVAATDATVLILGESGTGKELVARAVFQHSKRAGRPFLPINCAAIPEPLLESELFGHEKGAFTGAEKRRVGKFEQCDGGTIFLDEIGDMPVVLQAKLLRLLQEQTFERVGGNETVRTDVRLIAATNVDLERRADEGEFRRDLYFRLNVFTITLPPLRDRGDDIDLLTDYHLARFARPLGKPGVGIAADARAVLRAYPWPGNVRELQSVLKQAILNARGAVVSAADLPAGLTLSAVGSVPGDGGFDWETYVGGQIAAGTENLYSDALALMEREVLVRVLRHTTGNQVQAARLLGITRGSLRNKIRALGITIGRSVGADDDQGD